MAEGLNQYETVMVVSTKLGDEGNEALVQKFKDRIARHGTVESVDSWGKRKLAYLINKEAEGYYTLINFTSTPDFTAELDRRYQITDGIIRSMIIKKDPRHVKADQERKAKKSEEKSIDVEAVAAEAMAETVKVEEPAVEAIAAAEPATATTEE